MKYDGYYANCETAKTALVYFIRIQTKYANFPSSGPFQE